MSIAEKIIRAKTDYNEVFEAGVAEGKKQSATILSGEITTTDFSKTLIISGLPSAPIKFNLYANVYQLPEDDNTFYIRGLDYEAGGFDYYTTQSVGFVWLATTINASATNSANGQISVNDNANYNIFSYTDGTFTIKMKPANRFYFGKNFTYRWTAIL